MTVKQDSIAQMATLTSSDSAPDFVKDLKAAIGDDNVSTDVAELQRFNSSRNPLFAGNAITIIDMLVTLTETSG